MHACPPKLQMCTASWNSWLGRACSSCRTPALRASSGRDPSANRSACMAMDCMGVTQPYDLKAFIQLDCKHYANRGARGPRHWQTGLLYVMNGTWA